MKHLIVSTSLAPDSRSRILCRELAQRLTAGGAQVAELDLVDLAPPFCGGPGYQEHSATRLLYTAIAAADAVTLGLGIYNYTASAVAKTAVELGGKAWTGKVVSMLCAAGGQSSYMAAMSLVNALMLDFRCVLLPRFVYATGEAFADGKLVDAGVAARLAELAIEQERFAAALSCGE